MTWATLPETPQTGEAMRRAAAGVCGLTAHCVHGCKEPEVYRGHGFHDRWIGDWNPDTNRDDLARVFVAAVAYIHGRTDLGSGVWQQLSNGWSSALTDPRAVLAALLDLLAVPVPNETPLMGQEDQTDWGDNQ